MTTSTVSARATVSRRALAGLIGAALAVGEHAGAPCTSMADLASRGLISQARGRIVFTDLDGLAVTSKRMG